MILQLLHPCPYCAFLAVAPDVKHSGGNNTFDCSVAPCTSGSQGKGVPSLLQVLEGKLVDLLFYFFLNLILSGFVSQFPVVRREGFTL